MNVAIILAGGGGKRFGSDRPKQFFNLLDDPVLTHSIRPFHNSSVVDSLCVVVRSGWEDETEELIDRMGASSNTQVVVGGKSRRESVFHGLKCFKAHNPMTVFIHDGARPGVSTDLIDSLWKAWHESASAGVIPVLPVDDTLKEIDPDTGTVKNTLDRDRFRRVQTPQLFSYSTILEAHRLVPKDTDVTDDASLLEVRGEEIATIPGERKNRKLTYPKDLQIIKQLMKEK